MSEHTHTINESDSERDRGKSGLGFELNEQKEQNRKKVLLFFNFAVESNVENECVVVQRGLRRLGMDYYSVLSSRVE